MFVQGLRDLCEQLGPVIFPGGPVTGGGIILPLLLTANTLR